MARSFINRSDMKLQNNKVILHAQNVLQSTSIDDIGPFQQFEVLVSKSVNFKVNNVKMESDQGTKITHIYVDPVSSK